MIGPLRAAFAVAVLAACASPVIAAPAASSASSTQAALVKPSEAEALAFVRAYSPTDLRREVELSILERDFIPGMRKVPETAAMLDAFPNLGPELTKAMASQIDVYMAEFDERFFPRATAIVRKSLSKDDVLELTAFFSTPSGRKFLAIAAQNIDGTEVVERATKNEAVDEGVMQRQAFRSGIMTYAKLSEDERKMVRDMVASPAGQRLQAMAPAFHALQTELMNNPGPRFEAATEKALGEVFERVTGLEASNAK